MSTKVLKRKKSINIRNGEYYSDSIENITPESVTVAPYSQSKPITVREMVTRRINNTLCCCLLGTILIMFVSYYIAMNYEAKLNKLDSEIVRINSENMDLQAELDRYKSFNNVDNKVGKFNLLQKADKVIEVTALGTEETIIKDKKKNSVDYRWALGY